MLSSTDALSYLTGSKAVAAACRARVVKQLLLLMLTQHTVSCWSMFLCRLHNMQHASFRRRTARTTGLVLNPQGQAACRSLLMIVHNEDLLLVAITKWAANMLSKGVWGTITFTAVYLVW